jgi:pyruvate/2-oxoglutarate dehydrogenase complex dihydrolipoamide acyltransferase (E2) component
MATLIDMPKLSDTMTVGTLVKWLKKEGDAVANGDMIAEVETDKATMEVECFEDGYCSNNTVAQVTKYRSAARLRQSAKPEKKPLR